MRVSAGSAAPTYGQALGTNATPHRDGNKRICFENSFCAGSQLFPERLEAFLWCRFFVSRWYPMLGQGAGAAEPVLARILTPPQHVVKFFCRLHRLSYYVVMLRYFFRILFSSLCCVIGFVAGIVHGVPPDTFCFWACNSPYFILIFLLP